MAFRIDFDERAIAEILEILDWISDRSPDRAEKWYQGLVDEINTLVTFPLRCPVSPDEKAFGEPVRELLYGKRPSIYRILFTMREDVVVVLTIKHASRDLPES